MKFIKDFHNALSDPEEKSSVAKFVVCSTLGASAALFALVNNNTYLSIASSTAAIILGKSAYSAVTKETEEPN